MSLLSPAPARIDADLYQDMMNPSRLDAFARESRSHVRLDISYRAYWHVLFDAVPQLLELSGPDGRAIFLPFMQWAQEKNLTFDWAYHIWAAEWLLQSEFRERVGADLALKLMAAAASRWSGRDRDLDYCGIVIASRLIGPTKAVAGWKLSSIETRFIEVEQVEFECELPAPEGNFGCFRTPGYELDHFPGWRPIPL
ncbi:methanobactin biosynthesis protein MbnC [Methylosinus sporium]|uniref:methanobactin biosynthesis protein MbnC n=1 Tax=Methylosinus sporium TaxID=428 RepID=UPI00383B4180